MSITASQTEPSLIQKKREAGDWFRNLRDEICTVFEGIENSGKLADGPAGRFTRKSWVRDDGGGGEMSLMHGRVFEKVGVNISTVHGVFSDEFKAQITGAENDGQFWASGISLVAHMRNPHVPAAHLNTRFIVTSKSWFGGGGDLTPLMPDETASGAFHKAMKAACDKHDQRYYPKYKKW